MKILEQTRTTLVLRFGDALLPVFAAAGFFIIGLGAFVAGSAERSLPVGALGVVLMALGVLWLLGERHVTLTVDRTHRTLHVRRWRNIMPFEMLYLLEEIASFEVLCQESRSALYRALAGMRLARATRCMVVANFPTGPDIILVRGLSQTEANEVQRLLRMYAE